MYNILQFLIIFFLLNINTIEKMSRDNQAYTLKLKTVNNKQFLVPAFNLFNCQKFMMPKLDNAPVHHTFYQPQQLQQMYKQMDIDPQQLNYNLDKSQAPDKSMKKKSSSKIQDISSVKPRDQSSLSISDIMIESDSDITIKSGSAYIDKPRPPMRETGFTHFIHVPLWDVIKSLYEDQIVPRIQEEDRDLLMPLSSMHLTIMVFRLKKLQDLPLWSQVLKSAKKTKISIKGVNIFPIKKNFAKVLFLNIKGVEDLIDRIVSKAIQLHLVTQNQLSHIKFDKVTGTYKAQPHVSLLRTKGDDIFDFTDYLKVLNKINLPKATISEIRLSMIGTHDGKDYFNQQILQLP